jgi:ribonuclease VapC
MHRSAIRIVSFTERHATVAADAYVTYGRGRHPASLNFGDCMTYATARLADAPLLFVGDDFSQTDLPSALG